MLPRYGVSETASIAPHPASAIQDTAFLQVHGVTLIAVTQVNARTIPAVTTMVQLWADTRVFQVSGKNSQTASIAPQMTSANQATAFLQVRGVTLIAVTQVNVRTIPAVTTMVQL